MNTSDSPLSSRESLSTPLGAALLLPSMLQDEAARQTSAFHAAAEDRPQPSTQNEKQGSSSLLDASHCHLLSMGPSFDSVRCSTSREPVSHLRVIAALPDRSRLAAPLATFPTTSTSPVAPLGDAVGLPASSFNRSLVFSSFATTFLLDSARSVDGDCGQAALMTIAGPATLSYDNHIAPAAFSSPVRNPPKKRSRTVASSPPLVSMRQSQSTSPISLAPGRNPSLLKQTSTTRSSSSIVAVAAEETSPVLLPSLEEAARAPLFPSRAFGANIGAQGRSTRNKANLSLDLKAPHTRVPSISSTTSSSASSSFSAFSSASSAVITDENDYDLSAPLITPLDKIAFTPGTTPPPHEPTAARRSFPASPPAAVYHATTTYSNLYASSSTTSARRNSLSRQVLGARRLSIEHFHNQRPPQIAQFALPSPGLYTPGTRGRERMAALTTGGGWGGEGGAAAPLDQEGAMIVVVDCDGPLESPFRATFGMGC